MQKESNFKPYSLEEDLVNLIDFEIEDNFIVLKHYKAISRKEQSKMITDINNPNKMRSVDELGRVVIPKAYRKKSEITSMNILVIYLIDKNTIKIRTLHDSQ